MYCLDSNIVIDVFRGNEEIKQRFRKLQQESRLTVTPVVLAELYRGAFLSHNIPASLTLIEELLERATMLPFDKLSCLHFGELYAKLQQSGKMTQLFDLLTAAVVISHNNTLITRNEKDFRHIPGLRYEVW